MSDVGIVPPSDNRYDVRDVGSGVSMRLGGNAVELSYTGAVLLAAWVASVADGKGRWGFDEVWERVAEL